MTMMTPVIFLTPEPLVLWLLVSSSDSMCPTPLPSHTLLLSFSERKIKKEYR